MPVALEHRSTLPAMHRDMKKYFHLFVNLKPNSELRRRESQKDH